MGRYLLGPDQISFDLKGFDDSGNNGPVSVLVGVNVDLLGGFFDLIGRLVGILYFSFESLCMCLVFLLELGEGLLGDASVGREPVNGQESKGGDHEILIL